MDNLFSDIANSIQFCNWLTLAFFVWRIRAFRYLKGGEGVLALTLVSFACTRLLYLFDYAVYKWTWLLCLNTGLSVTSTIVLMHFLRGVGAVIPPVVKPLLAKECEDKDVVSS